MTPAEQPPAEGGSRAAGGCVLAVALTGAGCVAYAVPETAYYVTGLLTAAGIRKARTWVAARRNGEQPDDKPVNIVAVLQDLAAGGEHVRLTQLQQAAGLPDTKAVRALLAAVGIPIRTGVRAGGRNGPGVHHADVPPLPGARSGTPSEGCLCSSTANANADNGQPEGVGEGLRVEAIGHAGAVVRVPSELRTYTVTKTP
ncbi:hypothetical protein [Streptomyces sp. R33]|uniref:Uncharacterized protein n=1 Tax=Streptomyces sp. R33 TaxID=3238629 RepID=A0AB39Y9Q3_9ACTN